ncbi:MAG: UDP-N-acetylenolpyruvoylglucosamine reductase [Alphaproteobacteria bacterium CG11_big_fil_rev_8_21_14_0_20_44_7]|nr:MAG: UDP-N-acetylenolpyruvoylglucosamine reductase [Alphaproteobacteria bacterium CG11_big_fil_rev_8_21_14_0_20_44_7]
MNLAQKLPSVRGRISENADLSKTNWFQVGGTADILFKPADLEDLQHFLQNKPECPITILGVGSNIIIRDGGIEGVVIKLGRGFAEISHEGAEIICGGAALDVHIATYSAESAIGGLEFLSGIPGTMGGAVAMNAGAYGSEIKDVLVKAELISMDGKAHIFSNKELEFEYRKCGKMQEKQFIVSKVWLNGKHGNSEEISARIVQIKSEREGTQPVRSRTGGSTFKNPPTAKAWELIDKAGLRGFSIGGAQVSEKHCNFLINTGNATAQNIEDLIHHIQEKVLEDSGIRLETEIKIIGRR